MSSYLIAGSFLALLALGLSLCARHRLGGLTLAACGAGGVAVMAGSLKLAQGHCPALSPLGQIRTCPSADALVPGELLVALAALALLCAWLREPAMSLLVLFACAAPAIDYARAFGTAPGARAPQADPSLLEALAAGAWPLGLVAFCLGLWAIAEARRPQRVPLEVRLSAHRDAPNPQALYRA